MNEFNIIGDIAGQMSALERLVDKMPKSAKVLAVGDLIDRGPHSKQVLDWFMADTDNRIALKGNHEDIFVDWYHSNFKYPAECWSWNGGTETIKSFGAQDWYEAADYIPVKYVDFCERLPFIYQDEKLVVTHAPISAAHDTIEQALKDDRRFEEGHHVLWCRKLPRKREKFQVFGHNSSWGFCWFNGDHDVPIGKFSSMPPADAWAACVDGSNSKVLTGMHWPSMEVWQVPYRE